MWLFKTCNYSTRKDFFHKTCITFHWALASERISLFWSLQRTVEISPLGEIFTYLEWNLSETNPQPFLLFPLIWSLLSEVNFPLICQQICIMVYFTDVFHTLLDRISLIFGWKLLDFIATIIIFYICYYPGFRRNNTSIYE